MKYAKGTLVIEKGHTLRLSQHNPSIMDKYIEDWICAGRVGVRTPIHPDGTVGKSRLYQTHEDTLTNQAQGRAKREHTVNFGFKIPKVTHAGDIKNARVWVSIDRKRYGNPLTPKGEVLETDVE